MYQIIKVSKQYNYISVHYNTYQELKTAKKRATQLFVNPDYDLMIITKSINTLNKDVFIAGSHAIVTIKFRDQEWINVEE